MALDKAAVAQIAALARIRLSEAELEPLAVEMSHILGWVEQLDEVDTERCRADDQRRGDRPADARGRGHRRRLPRRRSSATRRRPRSTDRAAVFSPCPRWSNDVSALCADGPDPGRGARRAACQAILRARAGRRPISRRWKRARPLNAFITETPGARARHGGCLGRAAGPGEALPLDGIPLAIKDLFCTEGVLTTAASHILDGFDPALRIDGHRKSVARRRGHARQDQPRRVRDGLVEHDEPLRPGREPVARRHDGRRQPPAGARRLVGRLGRGGGRPRRARRRPAPTPAARSASRRAFAASSG